jgi:uncharacterized protein YcfJ
MQKQIIILCSLLLLSACSTTYKSRHACEKALYEDRGSIAGVLAGGTVGDGLGKAAASVAGGVAGHAAGGALYDPKGQDDERPYKRDRLTGIVTGCKPVQD